MSISIQCTCGKRFITTDKHAGKTLQCSQCGASIAVPGPDDEPEDELDLIAATTVRKQQSRASAKPTIECPDCGSDNWQRIELAYKSGTSQQTGTALFAGGGGLNLGSLSGTSQTHFAESIAPPPRQTAARAQLYGALGAFMAIGGGCVMGSNNENAQDHDIFQFGVIILIAGACLLLISFLGWAKAQSFNQKRWPRLFENWRRNFVCLKCGCVWIPDSSQPP